jgi:DNA ligase (NAD+)
MNVSEFLVKMQALSTEDLISIKGIGETLAQNYNSFLTSSRYKLLLQKFVDLERMGFHMEISQLIKVDNSNLALSNQTICITGTFEISRSEIKSKLEENGAKVVDSVTSSTTILLAGEKSGSKLEKAKKLNIKIVEKLESLLP